MGELWEVEVTPNPGGLVKMSYQPTTTGELLQTMACISTSRPPMNIK